MASTKCIQCQSRVIKTILTDVRLFCSYKCLRLRVLETHMDLVLCSTCNQFVHRGEIAVEPIEKNICIECVESSQLTHGG